MPSFVNEPGAKEVIRPTSQELTKKSREFR